MDMYNQERPEVNPESREKIFGATLEHASCTLPRCEDDVAVRHVTCTVTHAGHNDILTMYRVATLALTTSGRHRLHSVRVSQR